jgi:predicted dehydrogenase
METTQQVQQRLDAFGQLWRAIDEQLHRVIVGQGQVVEQAIHTYDICRYLLGKPTSVYCRQANLFHRDVPGYTNEDVSSTVITFENGALASMVATNNAIPNKWLS